MKLIDISLVNKGKFLNLYHLKYKNKAGNDKVYEIVSRNKIETKEDIGTKANGVTIVIKHKTENKYLLLKEFRMSVNNFVYNFVAGLIDDGESVEETIHREVFEETGLKDIKITKILPPAYSGIGHCDELVYTAFVEVDGEYELVGDSHENELIYPQFYSIKELKELLLCEKFTTKTQAICYMLTI